MSRARLIFATTEDIQRRLPLGCLEKNSFAALEQALEAYTDQLRQGSISGGFSGIMGWIWVRWR